MEPRNLLWNVKVSKSEREEISEIAKHLGTNKDSVAFRFAIKVALEATDPKKNPDALKNVLVIA